MQTNSRFAWCSYGCSCFVSVKKETEQQCNKQKDKGVILIARRWDIFTSGDACQDWITIAWSHTMWLTAVVGLDVEAAGLLQQPLNRLLCRVLRLSAGSTSYVSTLNSSKNQTRLLQLVWFSVRLSDSFYSVCDFFCMFLIRMDLWNIECKHEGVCWFTKTLTM